MSPRQAAFQGQKRGTRHVVTPQGVHSIANAGKIAQRHGNNKPEFTNKGMSL